MKQSEKKEVKKMYFFEFLHRNYSVDLRHCNAACLCITLTNFVITKQCIINSTKNVRQHEERKTSNSFINVLIVIYYGLICILDQECPETP